MERLESDIHQRSLEMAACVVANAALSEARLLTGLPTRTERISLEQGIEPVIEKVWERDSSHNPLHGLVRLSLNDDTELGLEFRQAGDINNGWPIIFGHGMPGSCLGPLPKTQELYSSGIRTISFSRPGYGMSTRHVGRIVADNATYIEALAQVLGVHQCSVFGRSGGGPGILASAALLPGLVVSGAAVSSLAPMNGEIDWFDGQSASNMEAFRSMNLGGVALAKQILKFEEIADLSHVNEFAVLDAIDADISNTERLFMRNSNWTRRITDAHADGLRNGASGRTDDLFALSRPWGFDPNKVGVPIAMVYGAQGDSFTPSQHMTWLLDNIPTAETFINAEIGHTETIGLTLDFFNWLAQHAA